MHIRASFDPKYSSDDTDKGGACEHPLTLPQGSGVRSRKIRQPDGPGFETVCDGAGADGRVDVVVKVDEQPSRRRRAYVRLHSGPAIVIRHHVILVERAQFRRVLQRKLRAVTRTKTNCWNQRRNYVCKFGTNTSKQKE